MRHRGSKANLNGVLSFPAGRSAEVDYLFRYKEKLVPIEVKSGAAGTLRSLAMFMDMSPHNIAVRFYAGEILISTITTPGGKTVRLLNLPYYLVSQIEKYLDWLEGKVAALPANS